MDVGINSTITTSTASKRLSAGSVQKNTDVNTVLHRKKRRKSLSYAFSSNFWGSFSSLLYLLRSDFHNNGQDHRAAAGLVKEVTAECIAYIRLDR